MLTGGRGQWRIRTRFRDVVLSVADHHDTTHASGVAHLLGDLRFELGGYNREVTRTLTEIRRALRGFEVPFSSFSGRPDGGEPAAAELFRDLEWAVRTGTLRIEEVQLPAVPTDLDLPQPEEHVAEDRELTFIGFEVTDQDGRPVSVPYRLELPDGQLREGYTGFDGKAYVDGIEKGGDATISLPERTPQAAARQWQALSEDQPADPGVIELTFVDARGEPLAGVEAELRFAGRTERAQADDAGLMRLEVEDLPPEFELGVESIGG